MTTFLEPLQQGAVACELQDTHALLAVSGGADSVALLRGLLNLRDALQLKLAAAHLNHKLRGEASGDDARWLEELCESLAVPLLLGNEDVAAIARQQRRGIEETARQVRYDFLARAARSAGCTSVVVAHTADDQAETILHHVLRGTGISGLSGMSPLRPLSEAMSPGAMLSESVQLARPMLSISRTDIEVYLSEIGQDFRTDESNDELSLTRNRIRHTLLPLLKRDYNPQVAEALLRLGRQAAEAQAALEQLAERLLLEAVVDRNESTCRLDCERLTSKPRHLVRECLLLLWKQQQWPRRRMGFDDWNRLADLVIEGEAVTLPGDIEARRRGKLLVLRCTVKEET